jgi:hypothetical protein
MAPMRVVIPTALRYHIFRSLNLEAKAEDTISIRVKSLKGPPEYITPNGDLPKGTVSEVVYYTVKVNGWKVVKAHQYRLPGGSVRNGPDPKYIRLDDVIFVPPKPNEPYSL